MECIGFGAHYLESHFLPALLNKKKQETPEETIQVTPCASMESVSMEKEQTSYIDVPLEGEEISALAVNPNDLIKVGPF